MKYALIFLIMLLIVLLVGEYAINSLAWTKELLSTEKEDKKLLEALSTEIV